MVIVQFGEMGPAVPIKVCDGVLKSKISREITAFGILL